MGSTNSISKEVKAIVAPSGVVYYALFEETIDRNVYPRTSYVSCNGFGTIDQVMTRILLQAADCESGGLKGAAGDITPESYIRQWRKALSAPSKLLQTTFDISFGCGRFSVDKEKEAAVLSLLEKFNVSGTEYSLCDPGVCEMLAAIINDAGVSAWKMLKKAGPSSEVPELRAIFVKNNTMPAFPITVFKSRTKESGPFNDQNFIWRFGHEDVPFSKPHWRYMLVGRFIIDVVVDTEKANPGCAESLIKILRNRIEGAIFEPDETVLNVAPIAVADILVAADLGLHLLLQD